MPLSPIPVPWSPQHSCSSKGNTGPRPNSPTVIPGMGTNGNGGFHLSVFLLIYPIVGKDMENHSESPAWPAVSGKIK